MLEHADRNNTVKIFADLAIIHQSKINFVLEVFLLRAGHRQCLLFFRQGNANNARIQMFSKIKCHAAPSAANIEHAHARLYPQLSGNMA